VAVDGCLGLPGNFVARMCGLGIRHPFTGLVLKIAIVRPSGPDYDGQFDPAQDVEGLGGDLGGLIGVVDVEARDGLDVSAAEVLGVLGTEHVAVTPHALLDEPVAPSVQDLLDGVKQSALGSIPARRRPRVAAPVGPEHGVVGLLVDVAA
jgi:hypothetical protein